MDTVAALRGDVRELPRRAGEIAAIAVDRAEEYLRDAVRRRGNVPVVPGLADVEGGRQRGDLRPRGAAAPPEVYRVVARPERIGDVRRRLDTIDGKAVPRAGRRGWQRHGGERIAAVGGDEQSVGERREDLDRAAVGMHRDVPAAPGALLRPRRTAVGGLEEA